MKDVAIIFDPEKEELSITIDNDTLIVTDFQKDADGLHLRCIKPRVQVKIIKKLVANLNIEL